MPTPLKGRNRFSQNPGSSCKPENTVFLGKLDYGILLYLLKLKICFFACQAGLTPLKGQLSSMDNSVQSSSQDIHNIHLVSLGDSDLLDGDILEISDFLSLPVMPSTKLSKAKCIDKTTCDMSTRKSMARAIGLEISKFESGVWNEKQ
jgi:hypothetical protein